MLGLERVHAVGIGASEAQGRETYGLRFYSEERLDPDRRQNFQRELAAAFGVAYAEVFQVTQARVHSCDCTLNPRDPIDPIVGGLAISRGNSGGFGTLGAVVERGGEQFILGASHVLWAFSGASGDVLYQPDYRQATARAVARLTQFVDLLSGSPVDCDAAIARLEDGISAVPGICDLGQVVVPRSTTEEEDIVEKCGAATGITRGSVFEKDAIINVLVSDPGGGFRTIALQDQFLIAGTDPSTPFSRHGDSGALVVRRSDGAIELEAIGMTVAGGQDIDRGGYYSVASSIEPIMGRFRSLVRCWKFARSAAVTQRPLASI